MHHAQGRPCASSWHHLAGALKPAPEGSPKCQGAAVAVMSAGSQGPGASHAEGEGRISPDLSGAEPVVGRPMKEEDAQQAGAAVYSAAGAGPSHNAVQSTRHTKRTPVPSVRLQRIMESEGAVSPGAKRPPQKKKGGKRTAEEQQQLQLLQGQAQQCMEPQQLGELQAAAHPDARRTKPRLGGEEQGSATPEAPLFTGNTYIWPDDDEDEVVSGSKAPAGLLGGMGSHWQGGLLCDTTPFESGFGLLHSGMAMQARVPVPAANSPAAAMWAPAAFPAPGEEGLDMQPGLGLNMPTDLLVSSLCTRARAHTHTHTHTHTHIHTHTHTYTHTHRCTC